MRPTNSLAQQRQLLTSMNTSEWFTPLWYIDRARSVCPIHLDPASCAEANTNIVHATKYYDANMDGLTLPWFGHVFLNPPYVSGDGHRRALTPIWAAYATDQFEHSNVFSIHLLVNAKIGYTWFSNLVDYPHSVTILHRKRISFWPFESVLAGHCAKPVPSRQPQASIFIAPDAALRKTFCQVFSDLGWVIP